MEKRKITAREVLQDIMAGKSDKTLMEKFNLSAQGLQSLFDKLVRAGVVTQNELDARVPISERTVDLGLFICPACGNIQGQEFVKCPRCGFTVPGKSGQPAPQGSVKSPISKGSTTIQKRMPKVMPDAPETAEAEDMPIDPTAGLVRMMNYCKMLSIAAVVTYSVAVIGLLFVLLRSPGSTVFQSLVGVVALGVPAVAISVIVFVSLRVLTEAVRVFSALSGRLLRGSSGRGA